MSRTGTSFFPTLLLKKRLLVADVHRSLLGQSASFSWSHHASQTLWWQHSHAVTFAFALSVRNSFEQVQCFSSAMRTKVHASFRHASAPRPTGTAPAKHKTGYPLRVRSYGLTTLKIPRFSPFEHTMINGRGGPVESVICRPDRLPLHTLLELV